MTCYIRYYQNIFDGGHAIIRATTISNMAGRLTRINNMVNDGADEPSNVSTLQAETEKLKEKLEERRSSLDGEAAAGIKKLTKRITILQAGLKNESMTEKEFAKRITKIEKEAEKIDTQLGLSTDENAPSNENAPRATKISRLTQRITRISDGLNETITTSDGEMETVSELKTETEKLMEKLEEAKEDIDEEFVSDLYRLTKRVTVLQRDLDNDIISPVEFIKQMTKIDTKVAQINNQMGLSNPSSDEAIDESAPRQTKISDLTKRLTRIGDAVEEFHDPVISQRKTLVQLGSESEKLKENLEAGRDDLDANVVSTVNRLTRRVTILQKSLSKDSMNEAEFAERMTKIEQEAAKIESQLDLSSESEIAPTDENAPRATKIARLTQRITRINTGVSDTIKSTDGDHTAVSKLKTETEKLMEPEEPVEPQRRKTLLEVGSESEKLKENLKAARGDLDTNLVTNVDRLTKRITVLKRDLESDKLSEDKFNDRMTKIRKTMTKVDNELGLSLVTDDAQVNPKEQISDMADRLTRINNTVHPSTTEDKPTESRKSKIPRMTKTGGDQPLVAQLKNRVTKLRKSLGGGNEQLAETIDDLEINLDELNESIKAESAPNNDSKKLIMIKKAISSMSATVNTIGNTVGLEEVAINEEQENSEIINELLDRVTRTTQIIDSAKLNEESRVVEDLKLTSKLSEINRDFKKEAESWEEERKRLQSIIDSDEVELSVDELDRAMPDQTQSAIFTETMSVLSKDVENLETAMRLTSKVDGQLSAVETDLNVKPVEAFESVGDIHERFKSIKSIIETVEQTNSSDADQVKSILADIEELADNSDQSVEELAPRLTRLEILTDTIAANMRKSAAKEKIDQIREAVGQNANTTIIHHRLSNIHSLLQGDTGSTSNAHLATDALKRLTRLKSDFSESEKAGTVQESERNQSILSQINDVIQDVSQRKTILKSVADRSSRPMSGRKSRAVSFGDKKVKIIERVSTLKKQFADQTAVSENVSDNDEGGEMEDLIAKIEERVYKITPIPEEEIRKGYGVHNILTYIYLTESKKQLCVPSLIFSQSLIVYVKMGSIDWL